MELNGFEIEDYNIYNIPQDAKVHTCPKCSHERKPQNQKQKCLSVFWDTGLGQCNHCGSRVQLHTFKKSDSKKEYKLPPQPKETPTYTNRFLEYINSRSISENTLKLAKVREVKEWMPQTQKNENCIAFDYWLNGKLINTKFRDGRKNFKLVSGAEKIFYNLDNIRTEKECYIVEGEFDALAMFEAGIYNVVSVPNGFNANGNINLDYLDEYYEYFENKEKVILALDNDEAGINGQKEFIRRLGAENCYTLDFGEFKDANGYLIAKGPGELKQKALNYKELPLDNVETLKDFENELDDFFINGCPKGYTTGFNPLDNIYSIEDGQFCIVTGTPQSGKSEFVDFIAVNYAQKYGFKTAYCSPENKPNKLHSAKLIKKVLGDKPTNIADLKYKASKEFINDNFIHVDYDDGYDLKRVLEKFGELVKRKGVKCFVIDPYNKVKLKGGSQNVNDYTNEYLNLIDIFCRKYKAFVYLVAHPTKMQKEEGKDTYKMSTAYDIKGGGEFFDMSYHILALRKMQECSAGIVQLKTLKVKFQHLGEPDKEVFMGWNYKNGRYAPIDWNPEIDLMRSVDNWDNSCILELTEQEHEQTQTRVFESATSDDFENSIFEGPTENIPF